MFIHLEQSSHSAPDIGLLYARWQLLRFDGANLDHPCRTYTLTVLAKVSFRSEAMGKGVRTTSFKLVLVG